MRAATQLPPGRHGLSREQVRDSQRQRMLIAMATAVAECGYVATSVADVIGLAGVSRETFYEQFANKEDCFLAAFDETVAQLAGRVMAAVGERSDDPLARLEAGLAAYLDLLASRPALARTFLIEVYGAGPAALRRRVAVLEGFVELLAERVGANDPERRFACEALVAAASSMVTMRVAVEDYDGIVELHSPLSALARRLLG